VMEQRRPVVPLCADAAHCCRLKGGPVWRNEEERPREPETSPNETARSSPGSILCALVHIGEKTWRLFLHFLLGARWRLDDAFMLLSQPPIPHDSPHRPRARLRFVGPGQGPPFKWKCTPHLSRCFTMFSCPPLSHCKRCKKKRIHQSAMARKTNTAEDSGTVTRLMGAPSMERWFVVGAQGQTKKKIQADTKDAG